MTRLHCRRSWVAALLLMSASACERNSGGPATTLPETGPGTTPAGATPAVAVEAESSLAIKRGVVMLSADSRVLRLCGQSGDVWLVQQDDLTLDETYARLAGEPGTPLYVEVRGERIDSPAGTAIPDSFKQAFLLEELLYASVPGEGGSCDAANPAWRVLARGNEPFWAVEVSADKLLLRQPGQTDPLQYSQEKTGDAEGMVTYRGTSGEHSLELTIASAACSDSMSGEYFAYTAEVSLDGQQLRGCARLAE
jgi:uncharacterized membrane protein